LASGRFLLGLLGIGRDRAILTQQSSEFPLPALTDLPELVGFFSYSRDDDRDSEGGLTLLRRRIQSELRGQLGRSEKTLRLFQDAEAIPPGTLWEGEISGAIKQSAFFIPIISPRVIQSEHCGVEFRKFLEREKILGRTDLIFPILYIDVPELHEDHVWRSHSTLSVIGARQYVNWCDFRFELDGPQVRRAIAQFCTQIGATLRRNIASPRSASDQVKPPEPPPAPPRPASITEPPPAPPRPVQFVVPDIFPKPPPATVIEPVERPIARSERRVSFPKSNLGWLCGLTLMLQGLIMFIGLWVGNPPITEIVLATATGGSLVVGFRVQQNQSAQSLRLALYASLIGLLVCFVLISGVIGTVVPMIKELTALCGGHSRCPVHSRLTCELR
jgi:TIR domain